MSNELKRYNHLNYENASSQPDSKDDFVDFLFKHSTPSYSEVNEAEAWEKLSKKIADKKNNQKTYWLRVAASVAILMSISIVIFLINKNPQQIQVASSDEVMSIAFPDGSKGILNENSSFSFPEEFGDQRSVSFTGEAYFDIIKSTEPFVIEAGGVDVKVLGTAFNLVTSDEEVRLYVDRGLVAFSKNGLETKVPAGTEAIFDKNTNKVLVKEIPSSNIMSWRNGSFKFENTPLIDALDDLSSYYNVNFKLSNEDLKTCRISASIDDKPLNDVLSLIESILNVKSKVKGSTVKISGKGC